MMEQSSCGRDSEATVHLFLPSSSTLVGGSSMSKTDKDICILRNPPGFRMNVPQIKCLDVFGIVAFVGRIFHCIHLNKQEVA